MNAEKNLAFMLSITVFLAALLFIVRLVAIKLNRDPMMRMHKPGTPPYEVYKRLQNPRKFMAFLTVASLAALAAAVAVFFSARAVAQESAPTATFALIFSPSAVVATFATLITVVYRTYIKK